MTRNKEDRRKSPWTISIGTAIFSLLLTMGYDYLKEKPILTTIWTIFKWIGNFVWSVLDFDVKFWWIIVVIGLFILIIKIIYKFKTEEAFKPDFYNYRTDKFKRWTWTWDWKFDAIRKAWIIEDLQASCPKCETPMINNSNRYGLDFDCPRCDFNASDSQCDEPHKIKRIILDNIDRIKAEKKNKP